ncbi:MAG: hypothetical protein P8P74_11080 [Crocinitomicaceae bacterium]|nr:hypothetical protein [Crocinitomicaceae bacterium]
MTKLKVGEKCFFLNGKKLIAECEIVEINLNGNPATNEQERVHDIKPVFHDMSQLSA